MRLFWNYQTVSLGTWVNKGNKEGTPTVLFPFMANLPLP
jgi:hypothetical protein